MKQIILATGVDYPYYQRSIFQNYIKSIMQNSNFDKNYVILLDMIPDKPSDQNIEYTTASISQMECLTTINCLQHGEFLKAGGFENIEDSDIILYSDGDMSLQRGLSSTERAFLTQLGDNEVFVGYNASPTDSLQDEAHRIAFTGYQAPSIVGSFDKIKIYNTGVLCMNKATWVKLTEKYIELFPEIDKMFGHVAKQQWLISYIIGTRDFKIHEMPYDFHNHTHYASPAGTTIDEHGVVSYNNSVVLFKHRWI